ncbi:MAG: hypothetical protein V1860_03345 [bacterium]
MSSFGRGRRREKGEGKVNLLVKTADRKFKILGLRIIEDIREEDSESFIDASIRIEVGNIIVFKASSGKRQVDAISAALLTALINFHPSLKEVKLTDFFVNTSNDSLQVTITLSDKYSSWKISRSAMDLSSAIMQALIAGIEYKLKYEEAAELKKAAEREALDREAIVGIGLE